MDLGLVLVQFVHVAGGAAWFGGSVFANLVLVPYALRQPLERQRELIRDVILGPERVMIAAAVVAALSGLVRGIAFGRITGPDALTTTYGLVWLASIAIAAAVFVVGARVTSPAARALRDDDRLWADPLADRGTLLSRLRTGLRLELLGITTVLVLMSALPRL